MWQERRMNKMNQNELYHYGVLGMKWGVRRRRSSSNVETPKPKKKTLSEMSDDELRSKLSRLQMEKQYKDLVKQLNPQQESKAKAFVKRVLERSGENIATQATTYVMGKTANHFLEKIYNDPNAINPKKGQKDK